MKRRVVLLALATLGSLACFFPSTGRLDGYGSMCSVDTSTVNQTKIGPFFANASAVPGAARELDSTAVCIY